jgi:two-component system response regulator DevR
MIGEHFSYYPRRQPESAAKLSVAEMVVSRYVRAGLTNKEIADMLGRAESTIKHQVSSILEKTGYPTRCRFIAGNHPDHPFEFPKARIPPLSLDR